MPATNENPWAALLVPKAGELGSKRVNAKSIYELYFAQDHDKRYMFIFTLREAPSPQEGVSLNGITVLHSSVHKNPAIILALKDNQDWPIFLKICLDLHDITEQSRDEKIAVDAFYNRLRYWQYFLKKNSDNILSKEEQLGLVGELLVLEKYVLPKFKATEAIAFWTGAEDDVQDFSIENNRIEIKTSISPSKNEVYISSLAQLNSKQCPIYLTVVYLSHAAADTENALSLFSLAERISAAIKKSNVSAYEAFTKKLSMRGLFLDESYNNDFYLANSFKCFSVRDEFPRITPDDVRHGVSKVKYAINLALCAEFETSLERIIEKD